MPYPVKTLVPPHMDESAWLEFEKRVALNVYAGLSRCLRRLAKSPSASRVHEARVALRRWDCIWRVLSLDGWHSKRYWDDCGKKLKNLRRMLGELRDCDVNIELGQFLTVPPAVIGQWRKEREHLARRTRKQICHLDLGKVAKKLKTFVRNRAEKLKVKNERQGIDTQNSAYFHLEPFIAQHENIARDLVKTANTPEELHALRLAIKAWRYILAEFYGLTNLELVRAQQILGKLNDLYRVGSLLNRLASPLANESLNKLNDETHKLLDDFTQIRQSLPYGLRPRVSSGSAKIKTN